MFQPSSVAQYFVGTPVPIWDKSKLECNPQEIRKLEEARNVYLSSPSLQQIRPGRSYKAATLGNARKTILEPGVIRFDVFQDVTDSAHFSLLEVYQDLDARDAHLETEHFLKWKDVYLQTQERKGNGDEFSSLFPEGTWVRK